MSGSGAEKPEYWYCLTHSRVEGRDGCPNKNRLGPYDTEAEAARALQTAAERTEAWDRENARWDDPDSSADPHADPHADLED